MRTRAKHHHVCVQQPRKCSPCSDRHRTCADNVGAVRVPGGRERAAAAAHDAGRKSGRKVHRALCLRAGPVALRQLRPLDTAGQIGNLPLRVEILVRFWSQHPLTGCDLHLLLPSQILDGDSFLLKAMGSGLWPAMVLLSEIVQTFILADFWCGLTLPSLLTAMHAPTCRCRGLFARHLLSRLSVSRARLPCLLSCSMTSTR